MESTVHSKKYIAICYLEALKRQQIYAYQLSYDELLDIAKHLNLPMRKEPKFLQRCHYPKHEMTQNDIWPEKYQHIPFNTFKPLQGTDMPSIFEKLSLVFVSL